MRRLAILILWLWAGPLAAQGWHEPARGSAERADLMDAFRPHAEWTLGYPIEFVVGELRVADGAALAYLRAQRPGGGAIDVTATPGFRRGEISDAFGDPAEIQVLYRKSGRVWVAVVWEFGATDVWFAGPPYCPEFGQVIPEFCP